MFFLDIHTHQPINKKEVISIQSFSFTETESLVLPSNEPISVGLHPWYASLEKLNFQIEKLKIEAKKEHVKLIGECGLDKLRGEALENQVLILERQIEIAGKLNKPLILHCVKAFSELIEIKDRLKVKVPMIVHGFNKNEELGRQLISKGFNLSFGAAILKENSGAAKLINQLDNFLLETDDSSISIEEIYEAAAILKKCSVNELKACIFGNWKKLNLL